MVILKCPECGLEITSKNGVCSNCGFDLENDTKFCGECGMLIKKSAIDCINCGAPILVDSENEKQEQDLKKVKNKKIGIGMIVVACFLFLMAFTRVNNDEYRFHKEHYEECESGYIDTKSASNAYSSGLFKYSYNNIADSYQEMMDDDMKEINKFRIQAVVLLAVGIILIFVGYRKVKGEK